MLERAAMNLKPKSADAFFERLADAVLKPAFWLLTQRSYPFLRAQKQLLLASS